MNILALVIIGFVLAVAVYYMTQGFFSALLHLGAVIAAGAIAFAIWEPITVGLLLDRMPAYAWTVGLVGPFALLLLGIRGLSDYLIAGNVKLHPLADKIGGFVTGSVSGYLTAGIVILGINFMPFSASILMYQPYGFSGRGVAPTPDTFMPLNPVAGTAAFYADLSASPSIGGGAFNTGTPLGWFAPELGKLSALQRLRPDPNSRIAATPGSVKIAGYYRIAGGEAKLDPTAAKAIGEMKHRELVVVDTQWHQTAGVFGNQGTLRMSSAQVQLVTQAETDGAVQTHVVLPVAARWTDAASDAVLTVFSAQDPSAYALSDKAHINWVFLVPAGEKPQFVLIRHLRLSLPAKAEQNAGAIAKAVGKPPVVKAKKSKPSVGKREGFASGNKAEKIKQTNMLPSFFRTSMATGLSYKGNAVIGGQGEVTPTNEGYGTQALAEEIYLPKQYAMVRLEVTRDEAQQLFGQAIQAAAGLNPPLLVDNQGQHIAPTAYVLVKKGGKQEIDVPQSPFESAKQMPFDKMQAGDKMYLYYRVSHGVTITEYQMGKAMHQKVHLQVK